MSNIYVARQPIFNRNLRLFGYELLYRKSQNNFFEGTDDTQATAALLDNSFFIGLHELTDGTRAFINFPENLLLSEIPLMLNPKNVVVELLERMDINEDVIEKCRQLKDKGYMIALDDFFCAECDFLDQLLNFIDIIKIDNIREFHKLHHPFFKKNKNKISFLAEKIETIDEFNFAANLGYKLFQGFFFSRPIMFKAKEIGALNINLVAVLQELDKQEPDHKTIVGLFERDLGLSYKLLRIVNSVYFGVRYEIKSIQQALSFIGTEELIRWVNLMLIKGIENTDNLELVKASLVRGKVLSLLASQSNQQKFEADYFITGIFSSIDVLLHDTMQNIVDKLPLKNNVKHALLGESNHLRKALNAMLDFEMAQWEKMDQLLIDMLISRDTFMKLYFEAVKWKQSLS